MSALLRVDPTVKPWLGDAVGPEPAVPCQVVGRLFRGMLCSFVLDGAQRASQSRGEFNLPDAPGKHLVTYQGLGSSNLPGRANKSVVCTGYILCRLYRVHR